MMNVTALVRRMRKVHLHDPTARVFPDTATLLEALNDYQLDLWNVARQSHRRVNAVSTQWGFSDFTAVGETRWKKTLDPYQRNVIEVFRNDTTPPEIILEVGSPGTNRPYVRDPDRDWQLYVAPMRREIRGHEVWIHQQFPEDATIEWWWDHPFPNLLMGEAAAGSSSVSVVVAATGLTGNIVTNPGYYKSAYLQFTSGSAAGAPVRITDSQYAAGVLTFTVEALAAAPAAGDTFELLPAVPAVFHTLVALGASLLMAESKQNQKLAAMLARREHRSRRDFTVSLESRDSDAPLHVVETETYGGY